MKPNSYFSDLCWSARAQVDTAAFPPPVTTTPEPNRDTDQIAAPAWASDIVLSFENKTCISRYLHTQVRYLVGSWKISGSMPPNKSRIHAVLLHMRHGRSMWGDLVSVEEVGYRDAPAYWNLKIRGQHRRREKEEIAAGLEYIKSDNNNWKGSIDP